MKYTKTDTLDLLMREMRHYAENGVSFTTASSCLMSFVRQLAKGTRYEQIACETLEAYETVWKNAGKP